jgi:hypothetical protein
MHSFAKIFYFLLFFGVVIGVSGLLANTSDVPPELLNEDPYSEDDDFNPGLGIFALIMVLATIVLIGVGIALGLLGVVIFGILTFFGVISSSVIFGFLKKNPASAFRMLFLQIGALAGLFCGIAGTLIASLIVDFQWKDYALYGCITGVLGGVFLAWLFNNAWGRMHGVMSIRYEARRGDVKVIETRSERF